MSFSVDQFLYARCCVVANGKEVFTTILEQPSEMPKDVTFEPLLSVAAHAYELKTGKTFNYSGHVNVETYSNQEGWYIVFIDHHQNNHSKKGIKA